MRNPDAKFLMLLKDLILYLFFCLFFCLLLLFFVVYEI